MKKLDLKMLRDLARLRAQALAVVVVVAAATGTLVATRGTQSALISARDHYYGRQQLADVFGSCKRAPGKVLETVRDIRGVVGAEGRIVADVPIFVKGFSDPATAHLISLPEQGQTSYNQVDVRRGRLPEPGESYSAVVSEAFAEAHGLRPGGTLEVVIEGRRREIVVRGIGVSPEYLYQIRPGDVMPDDAHYGVLWVDRPSLETALGMRGAFNDVTLRLGPGANEGAVMASLDRILSGYGGRGSYGLGSQTSNRFLSDELMELEMMTLAVPSVLLGVAAFLLTVVLGRLISTQREQIAVLKAFGYSNWAVGCHYAKLVGVIAVVGAGLGIGAGALMGSALTLKYTHMFRLPRLPFSVQPLTAVAAVGAALLASELSVWRAVLEAVSVTPAVAMRPKAPASYRSTFVERLPFVARLPQSARMLVRDVVRRPLRAVLTTISLSLAVGIIVVAAFIIDALMLIADHQFRTCERGDATVVLAEPRHLSSLEEVRRFPGVRSVEPFRSVGVVFHRGHLSYRTGILGLARGSGLRRVVDAEGRFTPIPAQGLVLCERLAELLQVRPGDTVEVELLEGARPRRTVAVGGVIKEHLGMAAYAEMEELNRLIESPLALSGAYVSVEPAVEKKFFDSIRATPQLAGTSLRRLALASFHEVITGHIMELVRILILSACVIAVGVLYSAAYIALAEKQRELATLRVLGFTRWETATVLVGELVIHLVASIPLGLLIGRGAARVLSLLMVSDLYRLPVIVKPSTYLSIVGAIIVAGVAVSASSKRRVDKLKFAEVLNARE